MLLRRHPRRSNPPSPPATQGAQVKLILEGARRRWIIDLTREDRSPDCDHSHEPPGDVYATTEIRTDDREQPMDGRRIGF